jgi:hypothetical protein
MPVSKNVNEMQKNATAEREPATNSFRQRARKAPGTRYGTWQDWRGVSERTGKVSNRHGNVIRDGR